MNGKIVNLGLKPNVQVCTTLRVITWDEISNLRSFRVETKQKPSLGRVTRNYITRALEIGFPRLKVWFSIFKSQRQNGKLPFWTWAHSELIRSGLLKTDFNLNQCFFGEHLLLNNKKPVAVVESEKTAVIASICFPEFVWLAVGSKQNLNRKEVMLYSC